MFMVICNPLLFSWKKLLQVLIPALGRGGHRAWFAGGSPLLLGDMLPGRRVQSERPLVLLVFAGDLLYTFFICHLSARQVNQL
jgi:hypothetical protein